ncbi:MAG: RNA-binding transcriptional accessory protein [Muribaculaceae bacterium]|nr:RNA-binding transcriptional accessory protein [Muribaculaceae bacterium]
MKDLNDICRDVAERLNLSLTSVSATIKLLEEGATVPFISRYRKEVTGGLDEVQIRSVELTLKQVRELEARREFVRNTIAESGKLDDLLERRLNEAKSLTEIEDIYTPFKVKKRTRAQIAREKGLEPLARRIMTGHVPANASEDDKAGASDIIAEWASESVRLRNMVRRSLRRFGSLKSTVVKGKEEEISASALAQYSNFEIGVRRVASHQYLALRRAEREGLVRVKYDLGSEKENLEESLCESFMPRGGNPEAAEIVEKSVRDAYKRLLRPSVENEISAELKEEADKVAIEIFSENLRQLLLASPLKGKRVLAIDPGYRTGCKIVALDEQGTLLDEGVIYPTPPRNDLVGARRTLERMMQSHGLEVMALGNGTASRETERFLKGSGVVEPAKVFVVSEDGASVYSASEEGRKEFPDKDVTVRGAVSIGRRLIDPLAELVKIDPKSIGVGQYQHDVEQSRLKEALDFTVMACVNGVGVDLNTASERLLSYVSGIGPALAANIVKYRGENGGFHLRSELKNVARLGDKAFELSAGFLRIPDGKEPLDNTGIHPESYPLVKKMAQSIGANVKELPGNEALLDRIDVEELARKGVGGKETMNDIVSELRKPGRDPRIDDASADFVPSIESFEQLAVGQRVNGKVNNITAFGAFIDLGIKENGLIHISRLSSRRVNSVSDVVRLGQQIVARVIDIDFRRRRISLELVEVV